MSYTLKNYLDDTNKIEADILKIIRKYYIEGTGVDVYGQVQAGLIEAGNNIVDWRRQLK